MTELINQADALVTTTMRALVLADYGRMSVDRIMVPTLGARDVRLRVLYTGICGSDLHGYTGENGRRFPGQVMGHETVARVDAVGSAVSGIPLGALATINPTISCGECRACRAGNGHICERRRVIGVDPTIVSAFAEYLVVAVENVVLLDERIPEEFGALVEPLAVGAHAAIRGGVDIGDSVLVVGAGPIGQAAALAARRMGAERVIVTETSPSRRELIAGLGFEAHDPRGDTPLADLLPAGADVTLDAVGSSITVAVALRATRLGGTVVLVGMAAPEVSLPAYDVSTAERSLVGAFCYTDAEFRDTAAWAATAELAPLISRVVDLDDADRAFADLAGSPDTASKILIRFGG